MLNLTAVQVEQSKRNRIKLQNYLASKRIQTKSYGGSKSRYEIHQLLYYIMHCTKQENQGTDNTNIPRIAQMMHLVMWRLQLQVAGFC
jgi:hypothetical protein